MTTHTKKTYKLGEFGEFTKQYERARRPYPVEVFRLLKKLRPTQDPLILDLGCGTGISTRQLAPLGRVVGCDPDARMLQAARKHPKITKEKYTLGSSTRLPFKDSTFHIITAFSAFHWFDDAESVAEIRRVLKPNGLFFIVNKVGIKKWGGGYRAAIIQTIGEEIAPFKETSYNPKQSLRENAFRKIQVCRWEKSERYRLKGAIEYVQSVSIWNSVPIHLRAKALEGLRTYFADVRKRTGKIERKLAVRVVIGVK